VEVNSTPSIRHPEKIVFEKVETLDCPKWASVRAALLTGTQISVLFYFLAPRWRPPFVDPHSNEDWDAVRSLSVGRGL
jgi:hypothetical protein